jgi:hypothetical protein
MTKKSSAVRKAIRWGNKKMRRNKPENKQEDISTRFEGKTEQVIGSGS